jgi:hypothetical protein
VGVTQMMPALQGRWCPSCGVAVAWEDEVCPSCGLPLERPWDVPIEVRTRSEAAAAEAQMTPLPEDEPEVPVVDETSDTRTMARIESAIPAEDDPESKIAVQERMPRTRAFLLASIASAMLIIGLALWITHPWDPNANSIKATEERDTSMAGFPGTVESLSGQDDRGDSVVEVPSGDDATFAQLSDAYEKLGRYEARADESTELFYDKAIDGTLDERSQGKRDSAALAIDVSNLIDTLNQVDVTSGTYAEDLENLLTLGNWLRNRVDRISSAWDAALASKNPKADEASLMALLEAENGEDGKNAYEKLFDDNYEQWKPERKE